MTDFPHHCQVIPGVIYTGKNKGAEHGGLNPDDKNVALLVGGGAIKKNKGSKVGSGQSCLSAGWEGGALRDKQQAVRSQDSLIL